eukprot:1900008-Lingulodinium_polyedra.AAC.1
MNKHGRKRAVALKHEMRHYAWLEGDVDLDIVNDAAGEPEIQALQSRIAAKRGGGLAGLEQRGLAE